MKKILFVVDERMMGGVSLVLEDYLNNIPFGDAQVSVLVLHNRGNRLENIPQNINVIYLDKYFSVVDLSAKQLLHDNKFFLLIKKAILSLYMKTGIIKHYIKKIRKKENISGYDVEVAFKAGFCTFFTAYGDSTVKYNWVHEDYKLFDPTKRYHSAIKRINELFDKIILVSEDAKKSYNEIYHQEDKTITIMNYVSEQRIKKMSQEESNFDIDKEKINFVAVGRLSVQKRFERILLAVDMLKKEHLADNIVVNIIGEGPERQMLENIIKEKELESIVHLIGQQENPYNIMKKHDAYILSSESESFGIVRIEALILGLPVITTNVACTNNIINSNIGIVVDNSLDGVYQGIKTAIENKEKIQQIKNILKNYSYEKENRIIVDKIVQLLDITGDDISEN